MNKPPEIALSTAEERREFVRKSWACMHNCELCGKCSMLHGQNAEDAYADYIEGRQEYLDVTLALRRV